MVASSPTIADCGDSSASISYGDGRGRDEATPRFECSEELILEHLPLVRSAVDKIKLLVPPHVEADELYSVGISGLMSAAQNFDPAMGVPFGAYAATRVRGAILDELRRMDWCPRQARARARRIKAAILDVEQRVRRPATESEISAQLGIPLAEYRRWLNETRPVTLLTLDFQPPTSRGEGLPLHELIADEYDWTGRDNLERSDLLQMLTRRIAELPSREKKVLAMYYIEGKRLAEIAAAFALTESRICQIHSETILGLRAWLQRIHSR